MNHRIEDSLEKRRWAVHALTQVLTHGRMLDEVLVDIPVSHRSWVHEVTAGCLRWKGRLDAMINQLSLKKKPSGGVRKALWMGSYQLLNQRQVPPAWVVSETVDWVRRKEGDTASRFVNALLRRVSDHVESWRSLEWPDSVSQAEQAQWASLPEWLWSRLIRDHGKEWAKDFALASLARPDFWVRSRREVLSAVQGPIAESWRLEAWRPIHETSEYLSGDLFVQDISSQILIRDFCDEAQRVLGKIEPRSILDLCAAPGGKSAGLAWNGWSVFATDRQAETVVSRNRFAMLQENAQRLGGIRVVDRPSVGDLPQMDAVWVDAPCTGTGLLRRHPEIRWIKDEKTLAALNREQAALLLEGAGKVRPGGLLMYSVCSVLRSDELENVVRTAALKGFSTVRQWALAPHLEPFGDGFSAMLWIRES